MVNDSPSGSDDGGDVVDAPASAEQSEKVLARTGGSQALGPESARGGIVSGSIEIAGPGGGAVGEAPPEVHHETIISLGSATKRFVVLEEAWIRGLGDSCLAHDLQTGSLALLTFLFRQGEETPAEKEERRRILADVRVLTTLSHAHMVVPYDVGVFDGWWFMATPYRSAINLREWLSRKRRSWQEIVPLFVAAGRGLSALHGAGLVHGAISVTTILIKEDGSVRLDCRFARQSHASTAAPHLSPPSEMGGRRREDESTRVADQRLFCACLYEALHGRWPRGGEPATVGAGDAIPRWLIATVEQGLAAPSGRGWPDMKSLVDRLESGGDSGWLRGLLLVGVATAAVAVGLAHAAQVRQKVAVCTQASEALLAPWTTERKDAMRAAFVAAAPAYGAQTWRRVEATLDGDVGALRRDHRKSCRAGIEGAKDAQRQACLAARMVERRAVIELLSRPDEGMVRSAVRVVDDLTPLGTCDRPMVASHRQQVYAPHQRARVDALVANLARAKILGDAGFFREAIEVAEQQLDEARSLPGDALEAEVSFRLGVLQSAGGSPASGARWLARAAWQAEANHLDELAADAQTLLVFVVGYLLEDASEARSWADHADAAVKRLGGDAARESRLAFHRGTVELTDGRHDEAVESYTLALEQLDRSSARSVLDRAAVHNALGLALRSRAEYRQGEPHLRTALELWQRALGPQHPDVATARGNLGVLLQSLGRWKDAEQQYQLALEILQQDPLGNRRHVAAIHAYLGSLALRRGEVAAAHAWLEAAVRERGASPRSAKTDVVLGMSHVLLGNLAVERGSPAEALEHFETVERGMAEPREGADLSLAAHVALGRARVHLFEGALDEARDAVTAALLQLETAVGPDKAPVAEALVLLAELDRIDGEYEESRRRCERAVSIQNGVATGEDHPDAIAPLVCLGRAQLALGLDAQARTNLSRAHDLAQALPVHPAERGVAAFAWAQAIRPTRSEPAEHWLEVAMAELALAGAGFERVREEIRRWQAGDESEERPQTKRRRRSKEKRAGRGRTRSTGDREAKRRGESSATRGSRSQPKQQRARERARDSARPDAPQSRTQRDDGARRQKGANRTTEPE